MKRKVVITNQDTFIEFNLTQIIKSFYPLLDDVQVDILADDLKNKEIGIFSLMRFIKY
ncbi:MAG: hypothetical protein CM15mV11_3210 [Caudoviricetes sp.]|nr:MAG: hypothetical protein CM15mV11_3210 [Caudoviricetes sp.]